MTAGTRSVIKGGMYGFAAGLVFIAAGLAARAAFGVGTVPELASDRSAPFLSIPVFFAMLNLAGGYNHLKELGIASILLSELAAGTLVGAWYGWLLTRTPVARARKLAVGVVAAATVLLLAALGQELAANYLGLPPTRAVWASIAVYLVLSAVYLGALLLFAGGEKESAGASTRRGFLTAGAGAAAAVFTGGVLKHYFGLASYHYDGTQNLGKDLPPVTPNESFYQVTKNNVDPTPTLRAWGLEVGGDVAKPMLLHLPAIMAMPAVTQETTLQCISNQLGGGLSSNAVWKGVPLRHVLTAAGMSAQTKQIAFHAADGFIDDLPIEKAMEPTTLLVWEINGEQLPQRHGFPLRLLVPGDVGEKSVKWLTKVEAREKPLKGFYEQQGWGPRFSVNDTARFDAPDFDEMPLKVGQRTVIRGTAFAADRGIKDVEVSTDGGDTWAKAEITYRGSDLSWVQWRFPFQPKEAGDITLVVRCSDKKGGTQAGEFKPSGPEPVEGWQKIDTTVAA